MSDSNPVFTLIIRDSQFQNYLIYYFDSAQFDPLTLLIVKRNKSSNNKTKIIVFQRTKFRTNSITIDTHG